MLKELREEIKQAGSPEKGAFLARFFKTGVGEYGEKDVFLGISVPVQRQIAMKYKRLSSKDVETLLQSVIHEERLIALFILVSQFTKGDTQTKKDIYDFYLEHTKCVNNWDLVDSSAHKIVGEYLWENKSVGTDILVKLAKSNDLWEKRIAMIATLAFINKGENALTFQIAEILINDPHDLIHKAVGWMLREAGKKVSEADEETFLKKHYKTMPRTALRYAIERFPEEKRKKYLEGKII